MMVMLSLFFSPQVIVKGKKRERGESEKKNRKGKDRMENKCGLEILIYSFFIIHLRNSSVAGRTWARSTHAGGSGGSKFGETS
jgi:hypothetical protein